MGRTLVALIASLALFRGIFVEAQELKNSDRWLLSVAYFNKSFPNNDELKLAILLTKAENWPTFQGAFNESGSSDDFATFPEKLKAIDPALYSELKAPYDRLSVAYKTLEGSEKETMDTLFRSLRRAFHLFFRDGYAQFWTSDTISFGDQYLSLWGDKGERLRSKFPFLVWLNDEYWERQETGDSEVPGRYLHLLVQHMIFSGLHKRVLKRAGNSFDYEKLMDALKAEDPAAYAEIKPIAEKMLFFYKRLPQKPQALILKSLEWFFANPELLATRPRKQVMKTQKDKIHELRKLFHDLSVEEQTKLSIDFPFQLAWIKRYLCLSCVDVHASE